MPKPKRLILNLMSAADGQALAARNAIGACRLFGVSENNVRVSLARLATEGLIVSHSRGTYQLTDKALKVVGELRRWRGITERVTAWQGAWFAVHCGGLGRSDRSLLRQRERALGMSGFRPFERDLYLRPANLAGGVDAVRERLYRLGLDTSAPVFVVSGLDDERDQQARGLWRAMKLEAGYRRAIDEMEGWLAKAADLELEDAARESFVIGDAAIRQAVFDPLLPEALVDMALRQTFFDALLRFDREGHRIWQALYEGAKKP
ncbi:PaaX domain-containing protein [Alcanivorax hongdengensis A-11-3]|uniref:PaaX domain-containing protein n=1 Tax=Alcanivorax hongdengensis A-11-3 TaxID=1177179 RepID=L0WCI8_9GAMM|nr:PaaX family transcriptional regulator C-terminal domain-containing protein [Alcanivorax hongdengensis]EKF74714.1 PaaX domain-containing protein [Alcanivorax hongdengensis A-11-3]